MKLRLHLVCASALMAFMMQTASISHAQTSRRGTATPSSYAEWGGVMLTDREQAEAQLPSLIVPGARKGIQVKLDGGIVVFDQSSFPDRRTTLANPLPTLPTLMLAKPDGQALFVAGNSAGTSGHIARIDLESGEASFRVTLPPSQLVAGIAVSPDGNKLAVITSGSMRRLVLLDAASGQELFGAEVQASGSVSYSSGGAQIITAGADKSGRRGVIEFWDVSTGERAGVISRAGPISEAAISPDGQRLAVINTAEFSASVLRLPDGAELFKLNGHGDALRSIAFNNSGDQIVTGSNDLTARVWNSLDGSLVATIDGHKASIAKWSNGTPHPFVVASFPAPSIGKVYNLEGSDVITFGSDGAFIFWRNAGYVRQQQQEAFEYAISAAEAGDVIYMSMLSRSYEEGVGGAPKDIMKARQWLERAAATGHAGTSVRLANRLIAGSHDTQDCAKAAGLLRRIKSDRPSGDLELDKANASQIQTDREAAEKKALIAVGGLDGASGMPSQVQADLLEAQMIDALTKQDHKAFLDNLCASEFLGHADNLPSEARNELYYHRAVALRATGKPLAALDALNTYLNNAGRNGVNYQEAIMMLRPLQTEAAKQ